MITLDSNQTNEIKGFTVNLNIQAIANVRQDRIDRNPGASGLNGKNIILTGRMKESSVGNNHFFYLSCLFFDGDDVANGKHGRITDSVLTRRYCDTQENVYGMHFIVRDAENMSERQILERLMEDRTYLRRINQTTQCLPIRFEDGQPFYGDHTRTAPVYEYEIATLPAQTEQVG